MMASRLTSLLNKYERNYNSAYLTWYKEGLDKFLEPEYNPEWILRGTAEIDWRKTKNSPKDVFVMFDNSLVSTNSLGVWQADRNQPRSRNRVK